MRAYTIIFLALLSLPAVAENVSRGVPKKFLGDWCTKTLPQEEATGESDIRISPSEIGYYRDSGKILAATAIGDHLSLIVMLKEGDRIWLDTHAFELSKDGKSITSIREDGQLIIRIRCSL